MSRRPSAAIVVSLVAVFFSLTGAAVAASRNQNLRHSARGDKLTSLTLSLSTAVLALKRDAWRYGESHVMVQACRHENARLVLCDVTGDVTDLVYLNGTPTTASLEYYAFVALDRRRLRIDTCWTMQDGDPLIDLCPA